MPSWSFGREYIYGNYHTSYAITNLEPGILYNIRVRVMCDNNEFAYSDVISAMTSEASDNSGTTPSNNDNSGDSSPSPTDIDRNLIFGILLIAVIVCGAVAVIYVSVSKQRTKPPMPPQQPPSYPPPPHP